MRVLLDETPCPTTADSISDAILAASAVAESRGRMIVEVIVDGKHLTSDQLGDANAAEITAEEIRLTSADPFQLVGETFQDASRSLTEANQLQQSAAELLQADQIPQAMQQLQEAISIWLSVQQALTMGLQVAAVNPAECFNQEPGAEGDTFQSLVDQLNAQLKSMHDSLEGKDITALADNLLYEMPAVVKRWQDLLDDLQTHIAERNGKH